MSQDQTNNTEPAESSAQSGAEESREGQVSERAANPTPPDTDTTTSRETHDSPQLPPADHED